MSLADKDIVSLDIANTKNKVTVLFYVDSFSPLTTRLLDSFREHKINVVIQKDVDNVLKSVSALSPISVFVPVNGSMGKAHALYSKLKSLEVKHIPVIGFLENTDPNHPIFFNIFRFNLNDCNVANMIENIASGKEDIASMERSTVLYSIMSLVEALESKDQYTRFHSENVAKYSVTIAKSFGYTSDELEEIKCASLLHDIGKIGIKDAVLLKPDTLSYEERNIIKEHPVKGANILSFIPSLSSISLIVRHHHERYDGNGYPGILKGDSIPLSSRILMVSDTFDAVTTDRPYRKRLTDADAISIIEKGAGTQFCPLVVAKALKVLSSLGQPS